MQLSLDMRLLLVWLWLLTIGTASTASALLVQQQPTLNSLRQLAPSMTYRYSPIWKTSSLYRHPSPTALTARRGRKGAEEGKAPIEDEIELDNGLLNVLQAEVFLATVPLLLLVAYIAVGLNLSSP